MGSTSAELAHSRPVSPIFAFQTGPFQEELLRFHFAVSAGVVADIVQQPDTFLLPSENIRAALSRFEEPQCKALPGLSARADPRSVGYVTEAYAPRRYAQGLERRSSAELGQRNLFSLGKSSPGVSSG